jgi:hypothetical protein
MRLAATSRQAPAVCPARLDQNVRHDWALLERGLLNPSVGQRKRLDPLDF